MGLIYFGTSKFENYTNRPFTLFKKLTLGLRWLHQELTNSYYPTPDIRYFSWLTRFCFNGVDIWHNEVSATKDYWELYKISLVFLWDSKSVCLLSAWLLSYGHLFYLLCINLTHYFFLHKMPSDFTDSTLFSFTDNLTTKKTGKKEFKCAIL